MPQGTQGKKHSLKFLELTCLESQVQGFFLVTPLSLSPDSPTEQRPRLSTEASGTPKVKQ